jgi:DNA-binding MarR family transcriptional regulator
MTTAGTSRADQAGPNGGGGTPLEIDLRLAGLVVELMDRTRQSVREVGEEEGLSVPQLDVLRRLRQGPSPMRRLAVQMNCEASNLTGLVDRLEARGLVERRPFPEDRRVKCVALTDAGEELGRQVWQEVAGRCELNRLSDSRKELVASALREALRTGEIDLREEAV